MFRKSNPFRQLRLKNERICSGIGIQCLTLSTVFRKVNGYAPEKVAVERICSGIGGLRRPESVGFSIVGHVLPTEQGKIRVVMPFLHPRDSP